MCEPTTYKACNKNAIKSYHKMVHQIKLNVQIVITMLDRTSKYLPIFIRKRNSFPGDLITAFTGLFLVTTHQSIICFSFAFSGVLLELPSFFDNILSNKREITLTKLNAEHSCNISERNHSFFQIAII